MFYIKNGIVVCELDEAEMASYCDKPLKCWCLFRYPNSLIWMFLLGGQYRSVVIQGLSFLPSCERRAPQHLEIGFQLAERESESGGTHPLLNYSECGTPHFCSYSVGLS